jgi:type VI secretion system protein ImpK
MDYLDEDTLVWDEKQSNFVSKDEGSDSLWAPVDASRGRSEFLHDFDKAENQLLNISSELLAITLKVPTLPEPEDVSTLRQQLVDAVNNIKTKGAELNYPVAVIDKLCFLYAVVLDEIIIYCDWGESRGWENKTLLSEIFGMRNGGELFFTVADKALRQPHKMIDLLEIIYIFINIGFKGQYRERSSEQLKAFTHQLEQVISQYRPSGNIYCHTRTTLPQMRKPTRRKRYMLTTVFFLCLIITSVGLTHFWYNKTHPQRARDFSNLANFSNRYVMSGQVNDIVFISQDGDLENKPQRASKIELVDATPPANLTTSYSSWLVQLATFSSRANAEKFVANLMTSKYQPQVDEFNNFFRVVVQSDSSEQAREIKSWYVEKESLTPIIVRNTQQDNKSDNEVQRDD